VTCVLPGRVRHREAQRILANKGLYQTKGRGVTQGEVQYRFFSDETFVVDFDFLDWNQGEHGFDGLPFVPDYEPCKRNHPWRGSLLFLLLLLLPLL
jgi:hypothetical protein